RSQLDDSLQPYGLEVPEGLDLTQPSTLYVWLHGRGDKNTDLYFIRDREKKRSPFQFEDGITLHPFGRHCIGFKAAGEVDVLEAIRDVQRRYRIDETRIVLLGFSMGGAGAWHLGAHHAGKWAAVHAGAGFAETAQYNRLKPENYPPSYEQTLWRIYDVPNYARNFFNVPLVAYSGENDKQIQAAQVMAAALEREGKALYHVIGPEMGHKYHPDALTEIKAWLKTQLVKAAEPRMSWHWQTRTLRYAGDEAWQITGLKEHYQDSRLDAVIKDAHKVRITTKNITSFRRKQLGQTLTIDGQPISAGSPNHFLRDAEGQWSRGEQSSGLHKRPGLQGPIDDAFLEPFLEVTPAKLSPWHEFESKHFHERWSALFRGQVRSKTAEALTEQDRQAYHLLYWGTPMSDPAIKRFMTSTPIQWSDQEIRVGDQHWDSQHHMLLMIYPNPEQPDRYIVLNSGPTFREAHDRTNSIQNPKLGDWAIIDTRTPPNDQAAGKVVASG
ncbi:MAG: prolyl oligopeptidase family serine peptidase, partial [Verrucomicrobiales bacterium]